MSTIKSFDDLIARLRSMHSRKRVALACPADSHTEYVVRRGLQEGVAEFLLVCGGKCTPEFDALRRQYPQNVQLIEEPTPDDAARRAVALVREGKAEVLMKGTINTDVLLRAVLDKQCGLLEQGRVMCHVTVTQMPCYKKLLVFSDAAVVPRPTLEQFDAIVDCAINVSRSIGVAEPKVALINFSEKVNEKFQQTISYEELKKRAAEGRYGATFVAGPMDVRTACDAESGRIKGISSPVVGDADVLIFPCIEAGNVFYKAITTFAKADTAGMLCGTTVPVVVASRADSCESKFYSLAMACVALRS